MAQRQSLTDKENAPELVGTIWTVRNPHPGFGTDPNIINERGNTHYPRYVDHPTQKRVDTTLTQLGKDQSRTNVIETEYPDRVLVNNPEEEIALLGDKADIPASFKIEKKKKDTKISVEPKSIEHKAWDK